MAVTISFTLQDEYIAAAKDYIKLTTGVNNPSEADIKALLVNLLVLPFLNLMPNVIITPAMQTLQDEITTKNQQLRQLQLNAFNFTVTKVGV